MVDFGRISGSLRVGALLLGAACAGAGGGRPLPVRLDAADVRSLYLRRPLEAWRAYEGEYAEMLLMVTDVSPVTGLVYLDPVARSGGEGSLFWCRPETSACCTGASLLWPGGISRGAPVTCSWLFSV